MEFNWEVKWFSDLSDVWMECEGKDKGWSLCVARDYDEFGFTVWICLDDDWCDPTAVVGVFDTIEEAKEVGETIVQQWAIDCAALY